MLGDPVVGKEFFDREEILRLLQRRLKDLRGGKRRNIAILGLRKTGKTSILLEFIRLMKPTDVLPIYLYLRVEKGYRFINKFVCALLYEYLTKIKGFPERNYGARELIRHGMEFCPETTALIDEVLEARERDLTRAFELLMDLPSTFGRETHIKPVIFLDEFQRIIKYGYEAPIDIFREKIMLQRDIWWVIAGSSVNMMKKVVSGADSPLYGHFEKILLEYFDYLTSREFLIKRFSSEGITIGETNLAFLIDITDGHPFYLDILSYRVIDIAKTKAYDSIPEKCIIDALLEELFMEKGAVYSHIEEFIEGSLEKSGFPTYIEILTAIAEGNYRVSQIARYSNIEMTSLTRPLRKLIELSLIRKKASKYLLIDSMLGLWLKYVYRLKEDSYIPELDFRLREFKSQVSQMISEFKTELGKARESQIREIFSKKGFSVSSGILEGKEFDLIAKKNNELILGECKTGNITVKEVNRFIRKAKRVGKARKVLFSLLGITERAREICKQEMIEVWDSERINRERKKLGLPPLRI